MNKLSRSGTGRGTIARLLKVNPGSRGSGPNSELIKAAAGALPPQDEQLARKALSGRHGHELADAAVAAGLQFGAPPPARA